MILKDQASKLREIMSVVVEKQQEVCIPVAVLSCGSKHGQVYTQKIALKMAEQENKKVVFLNTETEQEDIKVLIDKPFLYEQVQPQFELAYSEMKENFAHLYKKIIHKEELNEYIDVIRKIEQYKEVLLYYCGSSINAKAMNLMSLSSSVVLIVDGNKESVEMVQNVLKVQQKIQQHTQFLLIGNEMTENEMNNIVKYLQKECLLPFENSIKGIGSYSIEKMLKGDLKEIKRWNSLMIPIDGKSNTLSERLMLME